MVAVNSTDNRNMVDAVSASTKSLMGDTQDRFLTLLVTSLQNQDPMNPMDNAEVTSQIAQLSTVNGIQQLNNTLLALSGQMDVSQSMQAANLIGKNVLVPGTKVSLGSDEDGNKVATPFGVDLITDASKLTVTILDVNGKAVRQIDMGPQKVGVHQVDWDGTGDGGSPLPDGKYTIQVTAVGSDGGNVPAEALTHGLVDNVTYAATGLRLGLGLAGEYSLLDVRKIMQ